MRAADEAAAEAHAARAAAEVEAAERAAAAVQQRPSDSGVCGALPAEYADLANLTVDLNDLAADGGADDADSDDGWCMVGGDGTAAELSKQLEGAARGSGWSGRGGRGGRGGEGRAGEGRGARGGRGREGRGREGRGARGGRAGRGRGSASNNDAPREGLEVWEHPTATDGGGGGADEHLGDGADG
eukprot:60544-Chlamydomonas_euryale.AAC.1